MKKISTNKSKPLPGQVFVWVVRKEITKSLLQTIAIRYSQKISEYDKKKLVNKISRLLETFGVVIIG